MIAALFVHPAPPFLSSPGKESLIQEIKAYLSSYCALQEETVFLRKRLLLLRGVSPEAAAVLAGLEKNCRTALLRNIAACARIEQLIAGLSSPRQRQILRLRYLNGLAWSEITDRLGVSESLVFRLHRKALRELAERFPLSPEA